MHIPDGYLSPSTCAGLYTAAAPFWYVALKRVKRVLNTRTVPLLSVFAAFSFVIMMFNLPLPGGTTGHAVGMGMASIVLGPAVSILAISMALLIQALFFGDGGITTLGANCFNMAIVGSLVAFAVYRLVAWRATLSSARRIAAAAIAGYAAINVAAFFAAVEFGIQPHFFHDASGAPLYAPYPLSVSIPAMMIGHLTFAGLAELVVSAGVVGYLQRTNPEMLRFTAADAPSLKGSLLVSARKLWLALGLLLALTPLGILAVGGAWGEWRAKDFGNPSARQQIVSASGNKPLPDRLPSGLERLSSLWKAPFSDYAPAFIHNASLGYFVSAATGVTLIVLLTFVVNWSLSRSRRRLGFIERTIRHLLRTMQRVLFAEEVALSNGLLQALDPRVKLVGIGALIVGAIAVRRLWVLLALFGLSVLLAFLSHVSLRLLVSRIWLAVLAFTGVIAFPAIFLTPGQAMFRLPILLWPVTAQGLTGAAFLLLRAETAATLSLLLILCTLWNQLLRALRFFGVPAMVVVMITMTYRYIFLLLETAHSMFESRQTRLVGRLAPADQRRFAAASVGVLLDKAFQLSGEVHTAMLARGFRGEARLLDDLRMKESDWLRLSALLTIAAAALWLGR
jgi:cobalt/nickel transport system permease protein